MAPAPTATTSIADYNIIQVAKQSSKGFRPNELRRIVVFDAGSVNGSIFTTSHPAHACLTSTTGIVDVCNVYAGGRPQPAQDRLRLQAHEQPRQVLVPDQP